MTGLARILIRVVAVAAVVAHRRLLLHLAIPWSTMIPDPIRHMEIVLVPEPLKQIVLVLDPHKQIVLVPDPHKQIVLVQEPHIQIGPVLELRRTAVVRILPDLSDPDLDHTILENLGHNRQLAHNVLARVRPDRAPVLKVLRGRSAPEGHVRIHKRLVAVPSLDLAVAHQQTDREAEVLPVREVVRVPGQLHRQNLRQAVDRDRGHVILDRAHLHKLSRKDQNLDRDLHLKVAEAVQLPQIQK